jgi:hypothetical protein
MKPNILNKAIAAMTKVLPRVEILTILGCICIYVHAVPADSAPPLNNMRVYIHICTHETIYLTFCFAPSLLAEYASI